MYPREHNGINPEVSLNFRQGDIDCRSHERRKESTQVCYPEDGFLRSLVQQGVFSVEVAVQSHSRLIKLSLFYRLSQRNIERLFFKSPHAALTGAVQGRYA